MVCTGLVFAYWDSIGNQVDKWLRPVELKGENLTLATTTECFCPMHPNVIREEPGSCPVCGMPLSHRKKGEKEKLAPGVIARVQLDPSRIRQAGIRTAEVGFSPLSLTLKTVGTITYDERKLAQVASRLKGMTRVETLKVNFTGMAVEAGDTLGELSSPELTEAIQEFLRAKQTSPGPSRNANASDRAASGSDRAQSSDMKLKLLGVTQAQIDAILARGTEDGTLPVLAPIGGVVVKKNVVPGQYLAEGQAMFELADLSTVWVKAPLYESQVDLARVGQPVEARVEVDPTRRFQGQVAFIQPRVDSSTRTVEMRCDLDNNDRSLRPGMFASLTLKCLLAETPLFRARSTQLIGDSGQEKAATHCPVSHAKLGSMGDPIAVELEGKKIWVCCRACTPKLKAEPAKYLARLAPPPAREVLSVPESAVIDTGTTQVVYVETEPGIFEGRSVELGPQAEGRIAVLEGLQPGEKVAEAGAFLIDAESRLNPSTRGDSQSPSNAPTRPIIPRPTSWTLPIRSKPPRTARPAEEAILRSAPRLNLP